MKNILFIMLCIFAFTGKLLAQVEIIFQGGKKELSFLKLSEEVENRTSVELANEPKIFRKNNFVNMPWLWVRNLSFTSPNTLAQWIKKGGMLLIEGKTNIEAITKKTFNRESSSWQSIPLDHELMRSFYLLAALPPCQGRNWRGFIFAGRLAVVVIPYRLLSFLSDQKENVSCLKPSDREQQVRIFVNILMVSLATDYKKDQIHLPEILKRLR